MKTRLFASFAEISIGAFALSAVKGYFCNEPLRKKFMERPS
jgi:hypothetical protein